MSGLLLFFSLVGVVTFAYGMGFTAGLGSRALDAWRDRQLDRLEHRLNSTDYEP